MKRTAYVLIAHGTRAAAGEKSFLAFCRQFAKLRKNILIQPAFLEICKPSIAEGIAACALKKAEKIYLIPLMFFPGRHVNQDIPGIIAEARKKYPDREFIYTGAMALAGRGFEKKLFDLVESKVSKHG